MLTLALPKGRLLEPFLDLCDARGLPIGGAVRAAGRSLVFEAAGHRVLLLKDADVPLYVEQGVADWGVAGLDVVLERRADVVRLLRLPFAHCRLCLIAADGDGVAAEGREPVLASKYPRLAEDLARRRGLAARVVPLSGSVELAARLQLADAVVDVVETGRTLRENGLHVVAEWMSVAPYVIAGPAAFHLHRAELRGLRRTLGG
jgi:ATP phosphoribosyltransferase